ncbi:MAG: hypothetical protein ACON4M_02155 [Crocinitomicaceae bacterium]
MSNFFLIFFLLFSVASYACNCNPGGTIDENVANSDVIIKGKVLSFSYTDKLDTLGAVILGDPRNTFAKYWKFYVKVYEVQVKETYKGFTKVDTINVVTGMNGASCGIDFTLGVDYIIYGFEKDYQGFSSVQRVSRNSILFWTNRCTRSHYYSDEEAALIKATVQEQSYRR